MTKKITLQQVFDAAWQAFVKDRKSPGVDQSTGDYFYVDDYNNRCAIGYVLTDEQLDKIDELPDMPNVEELVMLFPDWFDFNVDNISDNLRKLIDGQWDLDVLGKKENGPIPAAFKLMAIMLHDLIVVKQPDGRYAWSTPVGDSNMCLEIYYRQFAHTYGFTIPKE